MLGDNIKNIRINKKMGLNKTATLAGISGSYLSNIEKGIKENPSMDVLNKIATALNVSVNSFFDDNFNKTDQNREFKSAEDAMQFILKQPAIMGYGGFDANKMSEEDVIAFANELLNIISMLSPKYNK